LLARVQAERVGQALGRRHPGIEVRYRWIESEGDRRAGSLADAGGKGLFTAAVEQVLLAGDADLAVHSLKDLPAGQTPRLTLAAVPRRNDHRDCLITADGRTSVQSLRDGEVVGTSSPRRGAQVRRLRPGVEVRLIRGNVDTRLRKVLGAGFRVPGSEPDGATARTMDPGPRTPDYHATLLAAAGLKRLGLDDFAARTVPEQDILPAACQGALALQCRADDHVTLTRCLPLNHAVTAAAVHAERELVAMLGTDCHSPLAVLVQPIQRPGAGEGNGRAAPGVGAAGRYRIRARVLSPDGSHCAEDDREADAEQLRHAMRDVCAALVRQGAAELLSLARRVPLAVTQTLAPVDDDE